MGASETHEARAELSEAINEIHSGDLMVMRLSHIDNDGVEMPVEVFRYAPRCVCPCACLLLAAVSRWVSLLVKLAVRLARWAACFTCSAGHSDSIHALPRCPTLTMCYLAAPPKDRVTSRASESARACGSHQLCLVCHCLFGVVSLSRDVSGHAHCGCLSVACR